MQAVSTTQNNINLSIPSGKDEQNSFCQVKINGEWHQLIIEARTYLDEKTEEAGLQYHWQFEMSMCGKNHFVQRDCQGHVGFTKGLCKIEFCECPDCKEERARLRKDAHGYVLSNDRFRIAKIGDVDLSTITRVHEAQETLYELSGLLGKTGRTFRLSYGLTGLWYEYLLDESDVAEEDLTRLRTFTQHEKVKLFNEAVKDYTDLSSIKSEDIRIAIKNTPKRRKRTLYRGLIAKKEKPKLVATVNVEGTNYALERKKTCVSKEKCKGVTKITYVNVLCAVYAMLNGQTLTYEELIAKPLEHHQEIRIYLGAKFAG